MTDVAMPPHKRMRDNQGSIVAYTAVDHATSPRTSSLPSPTLQLTGHDGSVYAAEYSPSGAALLSTGFDMRGLLWSHANYENYNVLQGHKNAILDCRWLGDETAVTASADQTVATWDAEAGTRTRRWPAESIVNAVDVRGSTSIVTAGDDGRALLIDTRQKTPTGILSKDYSMTAVALTDDLVLTAGLDNLIVAWDVRKMRRVWAIAAHTDTVTCLRLHPEATHVLSNAMDHTLRIFDIRPFCEGKREVRCMTGHRHSAEKGLLRCSWSSDGRLVAAGSADRIVHIWDEPTGEELYALPGHKGCVNAVSFHPVGPVVVSCSSDKTMYVGELS